MRDPDRIPLILERIRQVWIKHPNKKLGQLLKDAVDYLIFYMEDEKLIEKLENFYKDRDEDKT